MAVETVSFAQIATAVTPKGAVLYGLTATGVVYEYNYSREVCERFRRTDYRQTSSASAVQAGGARSELSPSRRRSPALLKHPRALSRILPGTLTRKSVAA